MDMIVRELMGGFDAMGVCARGVKLENSAPLHPPPGRFADVKSD